MPNLQLLKREMQSFPFSLLDFIYFQLLISPLDVKEVNYFRGFIPWTSTRALPWTYCWAYNTSKPTNFKYNHVNFDFRCLIYAKCYVVMLGTYLNSILNVLKPILDLNQVAADLYFFFKRSVICRED